PSSDLGDLVIALAGGPPRADAINPQLPETLASAIDRALQADPAERFESAADLDRALAAVSTTADRRRVFGGGAGVAAAIVTTVALFAVGFIAVQSRSRTPRPAFS